MTNGLPKIELGHDRLGLPSLRLSGSVVVTLPLAESASHPVTAEMASSIVAHLTNTFGDQLPTSWISQKVWDDILRASPTSDQLERAGRFALSLYGWLAGAAAAGVKPVEWLRSLASADNRPGDATESIWTILEGRSIDEVRSIGAVCPEDQGERIWQMVDGNSPLGPRGGHQPFFKGDFVVEIAPFVEQISRAAPAAIWHRPGDTTVDWPTVVSALKPEVVIDPYQPANDDGWTRLKRELTGRRLMTKIFITDEIIANANTRSELCHGVLWQPHRYSTISEFIESWRAFHDSGLDSLLAEPETAVTTEWLDAMAEVVGALYVWRGRPSA